MMRKMTRNMISLAFAALIVFSVALLVQAGEGRKTFTVAFGGNFVSVANMKDSRLAAEIWSKKLAAKMGFGYTTEVLLFKDLNSLLKSVKKEETDMVEMLTPDYVRMSNRGLLDPVFIGMKNGSPLETYLLLVPRDKQITGLASLRGRKILVERGTRGNLAGIWLDTMLLKESLPPARKFFQNSISEDTPSRCLLPLYFHQADACVVTKAVYQTTIELNPKIGLSLTTIKESPPLLFGFIALRRNLDRHMVDSIMESGLALHTESEGKQILTLFGLDSLDRYKPSYLRQTEALVKEHDALLKGRK